MLDDCLYQCPECGFVGDLDAFDVGGADEGCLFCNHCLYHGEMESLALPDPDVVVEKG